MKNVYARGIMMGTSGGTFDFSDNTVDNVQGDYYSIGIFNYESGGVIANNHVSNVGDGIAANWSTGTQITNNHVDHAASGIHTDNMQGVDVIDGNTIEDGTTNSYGIFVFAPSHAMTVSNNTISNVDYGLTLSGSYSGSPNNTITFDGNTVSANIADAYVTTDVWWYFSIDTHANFTNNEFTGGDYAFYLESQGAGTYPGYTNECSGPCTLTVDFDNNDVCGQLVSQIYEATSDTPYYVDYGFGTEPLYDGFYIVDSTGNVCVVPPSSGGGGSGGERTPYVPPSSTTGGLIPVTGGTTTTAVVTDADLEQFASGQFPLTADENGAYQFDCVLESVTTLDPASYIQIGDNAITTVGQCSYLVDGVKKTLTVALAMISTVDGTVTGIPDVAPGTVITINFGSADNLDLVGDAFTADEFVAFAASGNPFDLNNFLVPFSVEVSGSIGS